MFSPGPEKFKYNISVMYLNKRSPVQTGQEKA